ncbi:MAG: MerR family DNA-binding transcriptional regulator [Pseudomonadota bacterium]
MTDGSYTISELAREFDVSTRTIRFYEEKGFLSPQRQGQQRIYAPSDRARIRLLLRGKRIGLSLAESMEIIEMYQSSGGDTAQLDALLIRIDERRLALKQQQKDLVAMLKALDEVEALCRQARSS